MTASAYCAGQRDAERSLIVYHIEKAINEIRISKSKISEQTDVSVTTVRGDCSQNVSCFHGVV
jgi:hypothetical protein